MPAWSHPGTHSTLYPCIRLLMYNTLIYHCSITKQPCVDATCNTLLLLPANQSILYSYSKSMTQMQSARHIWWGNTQREAPIHRLRQPLLMEMTKGNIKKYILFHIIFYIHLIMINIYNETNLHMDTKGLIT